MGEMRASLGNQEQPRSIRSLYGLLLILIILLGFTLHIHNLDSQSMWSDEGLSVHRVEQSFTDILRNVITVDGIDTRDTNPPLFFILLRIWRFLSGETVFAMRLMGAIAGVLTIPLIYQLGVVTFGRNAGLLAAFFLAISPFHIWQSQDLRNYTLLLLLNTISVYGLSRYLLAKIPERRWLILWIVTGLLGIYTHYFGFFVFAYGLITLGIDSVRRSDLRQHFTKRRVILLLGFGAILVIPALVIAFDRFSAGQQFDFDRMPITAVINHASGAYSVGVDPSLIMPWWRQLPALILFVMGIWFGWKSRPKATVLVLGYQVIPLGLLLLLSTVNPLYNGLRHLLIGLPPFLLLAAMGIAGPVEAAKSDRSSAGKKAVAIGAVVLAVLVLVIQGSWIRVQFDSPRLIRDDIRGAAQYIERHAGPDDIVVLHDTLIKYTFEYYYRGDAPVISIPSLNEHTPQQAIDVLKDETMGKEKLWFLADPEPRTGFDRTALKEWLDSTWPRTFTRRFPSMWHHISLRTYLTGTQVDELPDTATTGTVTWGDILELHGYESPGEATSGEDLWMTFYLSQPGNSSGQHSFSLRFIDENGREWAKIDNDIARGFPPTAELSNSMMRYAHAVKVPAGLPPGSYSVAMRLVRTEDGKTVAHNEGVDVSLGDILIHPADCSTSDSAMQAKVSTAEQFGSDLQLRGYSLPSAELRPGHAFSVETWWCALKTPSADYRMRLQMKDGGGNVIVESISPLTRDDYPPTRWSEGELLQGITDITAPAAIEEGQYDINLSLLPPDSDNALRIGWPLGARSLNLGSVEVKPFSLETQLPEISCPAVAEFEQPPIIELHGYDISSDLASPGDSIDLTLYWRSLTDDVPETYIVFVHLTDESGQVVAQGDGIPVGGVRPTISWRNQEVIVDDHLIFLPIDSSSGSYTLSMGLFNPFTNVRVPLYIDGERQEADRLILQEIEIVD